jgi:microcin C transport system ATP-binding protein
MQVLQLLAELQRKYGIAYLFISHDLAVIRAMAHRVLVMKDGQVVEHGDAETLLSAPSHPYTRRLLAAASYSADAAHID